MNKTNIIGIAGGSASGKSSISQQLKECYESTTSIVVIRQDDYYKDQGDKPMAERVLTNYDHPQAFDNALMIEQIQQLCRRCSIDKPTYDFVHHTRSEVIERVEPSQVIVLEGLFILENASLRDLCDIKIFVDTDADIRFIRRILRDVNERGRSLQSVVDQYMTTVRDMHNLYVEPSKRYADVIIPEGGHNQVAIDLLTTKISSIIYGTVL